MRVETLSHIACCAGSPVSRVQHAIAELGIQPELVIDVRPHYGADDVARIVAYLRPTTTPHPGPSQKRGGGV